MNIRNQYDSVETNTYYKPNNNAPKNRNANLAYNNYNYREPISNLQEYDDEAIEVDDEDETLHDDGDVIVHEAGNSQREFNNDHKAFQQLHDGFYPGGHSHLPAQGEEPAGGYRSPKDFGLNSYNDDYDDDNPTDEQLVPNSEYTEFIQGQGGHEDDVDEDEGDHVEGSHDDEGSDEGATTGAADYDYDGDYEGDYNYDDEDDDDEEDEYTDTPVDYEERVARRSDKSKSRAIDRVSNELIRVTAKGIASDERGWFLYRNFSLRGKRRAKMIDPLMITTVSGTTFSTAIPTASIATSASWPSTARTTTSPRSRRKNSRNKKRKKKKNPNTSMKMSRKMKIIRKRFCTVRFNETPAKKALSLL